MIGVRVGQTIGFCGLSGWAFGPLELHWQAEAPAPPGQPELVGQAVSPAFFNPAGRMFTRSRT